MENLKAEVVRESKEQKIETGWGKLWIIHGKIIENMP